MNKSKHNIFNCWFILLLYLVFVFWLTKTTATSFQAIHDNIEKSYNKKNSKGAHFHQNDYLEDKNEKLFLLSQNQVDNYDDGEDLVVKNKNKNKYSNDVETNENSQSQDGYHQSESQNENQRLFTTYAHKREQQLPSQKKNMPESNLLSHMKRYRASENNINRKYKNNDIKAPPQQQAAGQYNLKNNYVKEQQLDKETLSSLDLFSKTPQG